MSNAIHQRRATSADMPFLFTVMKAALKSSVEETYGPWDDMWQQRHFAAGTDPATHVILFRAEVPVGLLWLTRTAQALVVNRLYLLPEFQRRGIGCTVMAEVMAEARQRGCPVQVQVLRVNAPALRFYERLGFAITGQTDTHYQMAWSP